MASLFESIFGETASGYVPAPEPSGVTLQELIKRKSCIVRVGNKHYRFTVEPVTLTAKTKVKSK